MSNESTSPMSASTINPQEPTPHRGGSWVRIVIYVLIVLGVSWGVWHVFQNQQAKQKADADQAAKAQSRPVPVQVKAVESRPMPIYLNALGTVTPYMTVTVKARVSGELLPVHFKEGDNVRQGQTILSIDPKPYRAALDQAKGTLAHDVALLHNAQAQYKRYKALYDAGVTSKETLDTDEAAQGQYQGAIESDKAAIETAQLQLNWCNIQAPISGKIGLRLVDPGNIITANTTNLVVINQFQPIAVYFTLPEGQLPQVLTRLAKDHHISVEAWDRADSVKLATGTLLTADNQIDTTTGTGKLKAVFDNKDQALYPNQFVNIHLVLEQRNDALVIPSAAIQSGNKGNFVWVVTKGEAPDTKSVRMQPVQIALSVGQLTIIDSGVKAGDQVVVDGADRVRPGVSVIVSQTPGSGDGSKSGKGKSQDSSSGNAPFTQPAAGEGGKSEGQSGTHHRKEQQ